MNSKQYYVFVKWLNPFSSMTTITGITIPNSKSKGQF